MNKHSAGNARWFRQLGAIPTFLTLVHETQLSSHVRQAAADVVYLMTSAEPTVQDLRQVAEGCLSPAGLQGRDVTAAAAIGRHLCLQILRRLTKGSTATARFMEDFVLKQLGVEWPLLFMGDDMDNTSVVLAIRLLGTLLGDPNGMMAARFRAVQGGFSTLAAALSPHACSSEVHFLLLALLLGRPMDEVPEGVALSNAHVQEVFQLHHRTEVPLAYPEIANVELTLLRVLYGIQLWRQQGPAINVKEDDAAAEEAAAAAAANGANAVFLAPSSEASARQSPVASPAPSGGGNPFESAATASKPGNPFAPDAAAPPAIDAEATSSSTPPPVPHDPFHVLGLGSSEVELPRTLVRQLTLLYHKSTTFASICHQPEFVEGLVQSLFVPEKVADNMVAAEDRTLASVMSQLLERPESTQVCFNLKQASQEDLLSLLSVITIDYMAQCKDKSLPLLEVAFEAPPPAAAN